MMLLQLDMKLQADIDRAKADFLKLLELFELLLIFFFIQGVFDTFNTLITVEKTVEHLILRVLNRIVPNIEIQKI